MIHSKYNFPSFLFLKCTNVAFVYIRSCPVDETTSVVPSTEVGISRFTTEGFKFVADHPFVFVHCHIRICDAGNPNSRCTQGCIKEARKKRDVSKDDKMYPLAQGPLTIDDDMSTESTLHGKYTVVIVF